MQALAVDRPEFLGHRSMRYHSECSILSLYCVSDAATLLRRLSQEEKDV